MPAPRTAVVPRAGRLFKVGRTGKLGRQPPPARGMATLGPDVDTSKLSHVARRRIASPPMVKIERAVDAVGSAVQAWGDQFVDAIMRRTIPELIDRADSISVMLHQDASVEEVFNSLDDPKVAKATLEEAFRAVDKASSDDLRVVGVRTGSVVPNADRLQSEWIARNTNLIKAQQDVRRRVERIIAEEVPKGRSVDDIRKLLEEQVGYARSRAELTARDQTLKLYGQIQQERQQAAGFTHYVWTTSLDERVREEHAELDGKVIAWDDPPVVDKRTGRREHPGGDYQCLPGSAQIGFTSPVNRLFRRAYSGELTSFVTDSGVTLECTPNHPVLTSSGWKPAKAVQVGDYVVQASLDGSEVSKADVQHGMPSISEVFEAFALTFDFGRECGVASQFHDDGVIDEQVHVIHVNRRLRPDLEAALAQQLSQFNLADADTLGLSFRECDEVLGRLGLASASGIGSLRYCLARFLARAREALDVGLTSIADLHAMSDEQGANSCARYAVALGEAFDRGALPLQLQAFVVREWLRIRCRDVNAPASVQRDAALAQTFAVHTETTCDVGPGQTLSAKLTRVIDKRVGQFCGHVYNLETDVHWYVAQGLIVHNCRCSAVPYTGDDVVEAESPPREQPPLETEPEVTFTARLPEPPAPAPPPRSLRPDVEPRIAGGTEEQRATVSAALDRVGYRQFYAERVEPALAVRDIPGNALGVFNGNLNHLHVAGDPALLKKWARKKALPGPRARAPLEQLTDIARTPAEVQAVTIAHEFGHAVHLTGQRWAGQAVFLDEQARRVDETVQAAFARRTKLVTRYGDDAKEWFAEAFAAYHHTSATRAWLREWSPEAFDAVEAVLRERGMNVSR